MKTFIIRCCNYIQRKLSKKDNINPNQSLISHLKSLGVEIGENVLFCDPSSTIIDTTNPFLIKIGNNVLVANGFHLMTHDALSTVSVRLNGTNVPSCKPVEIKNNVYIAERVSVLGGVTIGNNTIIAAGSIVTKNVPDNEIWGGIPAHKISDLETIIKNRKEHEIEIAFNMVELFEKRFKRLPTEDEIKQTNISYLWKKYEDYDNKELRSYKYLNNTEGLAYLKNYIPPFKSFDDFIKAFKRNKG